MTLLDEIEAHLKRTGVSAHAFARGAGCGSSLVYDMRRGSHPTPPTVAKIRAFLDTMKHVPEVRLHRQSERIDVSGLTRVDSRACWNCGASGYVGCVHFPKEMEA